MDIIIALCVAAVFIGAACLYALFFLAPEFSALRKEAKDLVTPHRGLAKPHEARPPGHAPESPPTGDIASNPRQ